MTVKINCATEGASIAYTTDAGSKPHWLLYHEPVRLDRGTMVRARAVRLGYRESKESEVRYDIGG